METSRKNQIEVEEALERIEQATVLEELEPFEKAMETFLDDEKAWGNGVDLRSVQEIEHRAREERKFQAQSLKSEIQANFAKHDPIAFWEENKKDYALQHLGQDTIKVINYSHKNISLEFVDSLVDDFARKNKNTVLKDIFDKASSIVVITIGQKNDFVILGIENNEGRKMGLLFVGQPDFAIKLAELNGERFEF